MNCFLTSLSPFHQKSMLLLRSSYTKSLPLFLLSTRLVMASSTPNPKARSFATGPPAAEKGIDFYTVDTPNGMKVTVAFAELKAAGVNINVSRHQIDFSKGEQKQEWFLKEINPNGRIPGIVDRDRDQKIWESGSILLYLAKHYDTSYNFHFQDDKSEDEMINWVFFQNAGLGPMQGQANHFISAAPEKIVYAAKRYLDETKRLLSVYEDQLQGRDYLVGEGKGKFSYADITAFPWIRAIPLIFGGESIKDIGFPNVQEWVDRIWARPATKGSYSPEEYVNKSLAAGPEALKAKVAWIYENKEERKKDEL